MDHDSSLQDLVPITRQNLTRGVLIDHYEHVDHDYDYLPRGVLMWSASEHVITIANTIMIMITMMIMINDYLPRGVLMWSAPPASSLLYFMFVYSRPTCDDHDNDDHDHDAGEMMRSHDDMFTNWDFCSAASL